MTHTHPIVIFNEAKGEIVFRGRRFGTVDVVGLCKHLDMLVGESVAAAIVGSYGRWSGQLDLTLLRESDPNATFEKIIEALELSDRHGGYGVTKLRRCEDQTSPFELEMRNPIFQASTGTGVKFILAYWIGALGGMIGKTLDVSHANYDASENVLRCRFTVIGVPQTKGEGQA